MTFKQFTALVTVAKYLNITKAAQSLRISQPSLSKHLKGLEEDYGIQLFSRHGKGIQLTDAGKEFLREIDPIVAQLEKLQEKYSRNSKQNTPAPLRVGGTYGPSSELLPAVIAAYKKQYPNTEVVLRSNAASVIHKMILRGDLEVAVCSRPLESPDVYCEPFIPSKIVAFAGKHYPITRKRELEVADLADIPLIIRGDKEWKSTTHLMLAMLSKRGCKVNIAMRCDSPGSIKTAVKKGLGVGILYEDAVKPELMRGVFRQLHISGLPMEGQTYIIYSKQRPLSPGAATFLDLLRQHGSRQSALHDSHREHRM